MKNSTYELSSPEAAHVPILQSQSKRTVKHENPEKFNAFVNAAAARRRLDQTRDDPCAGALRKRVVNWSSVRSDCYDAESIPIALAGLTSLEFPTPS